MKYIKVLPFLLVFVLAASLLLVTPGTRAEAANSHSSIIWAFFLEPWPIWPHSVDSRNSHRTAGPTSFLIWPRFVDS